MDCENMKFWGDFVDDGKEVRKFIRLRCKSWSCPACSKVNASRLRRLLRAAVESKLDELRAKEVTIKWWVKLVTLTLPGRDYRGKTCLSDAEKDVKRGLNRLLQMLRKKYGVSSYAWVKEYQRDGFPHIHLLLIGREIAGKEILGFIRGLWTQKYGMGNVDIQAVRDSRGAVQYLVKYLSKETSGGVQGYRVFSLSADLRRRVKDEKENSRGSGELVRIGKINNDGSIGEILWEKSSGLGFDEWLEKNNLEKVLDFFESKKYGKGEQVSMDL